MRLLTKRQFEARRRNGLANKVHGMTGSRIHQTWSAMRNRCENKNNREYHRYGGRGISVCRKWSKFENFYSDMGEPPPGNYSIDRINVNGNYEPRNCRWATPRQQANNRTNNDKITFDGKTKTLMEWSRAIGISQDTLWVRIYRLKWPINKALTKSTIRTHCPSGHEYPKKRVVLSSRMRCRVCASAKWKRSNDKRRLIK